MKVADPFNDAAFSRQVSHDPRQKKAGGGEGNRADRTVRRPSTRRVIDRRTCHSWCQDRPVRGRAAALPGLVDAMLPQRRIEVEQSLRRKGF